MNNTKNDIKEGRKITKDKRFLLFFSAEVSKISEKSHLYT